MPSKIVIIGPESTGKSTLCEQLADHYNTLWCPEYAREYLIIHGTKYTYDDLLTIAQGQVELEEKYVQLVQSSDPDSYRDYRDREGVQGVGLGRSNPEPGTSKPPRTSPHSVLFIDTDMYVMKVWCEFVFGKCHQYILDQIAERKYDLYLLCDIDLPWTHDELREYPDIEPRQQLYKMYKDLMMHQPVPWTEISGDSVQRFRTAVHAVGRLLKA